jgi:hypothetical protein
MDSFFNIFFKKKNSAPRNEGGIVLNYEQLGKPFSIKMYFFIRF